MVKNYVEPFPRVFWYTLSPIVDVVETGEARAATQTLPFETIVDMPLYSLPDVFSRANPYARP